MSSSLQNALAAIDGCCAEPVMRAKLRGLMCGYAARWAGSPMVVTGIEETLTSDLYNPETSARSRSFEMVGKLDLRIEEDGRAWICDHKTTSEDIGDPDAAYWRQLAVEGQHHHYGLLEHLSGRRIEGAIWDVVRKPGISPKQIAKGDQAELFKTGLYFGGVAHEEDKTAVRAEGSETPTLYEHRLAWDCTNIRPEWYFERRRIARLDANTIEYATELWGHTQELLLCRRTGRWPRNSGACLLYKRPCQYLGICSGYDTPDSQNWQRRTWVHPELTQIEGSDGRGILTNSRIRCFQTCRKRHFYQYELGIERVKAEEVEALNFGIFWHKAMDVYFQGQLKGHDDTTNASEPVNAFGYASDNSAED